MFYCFSTFSLSYNRKIRLVRVFSSAGREIWFERGGGGGGWRSVNPGLALSELTQKSFLRKTYEIQGDLVLTHGPCKLGPYCRTLVNILQYEIDNILQYEKHTRLINSKYWDKNWVNKLKFVSILCLYWVQ